jgi:predicted porin
MQKKLLTLAVAGALAAPALAVAQSTVEVYGTVNMAFGQFRFTEGNAAQTIDGATPAAATAHSSISKWDVANGASNYGVRSRENLGGGLAGWIQIEQNAPLERSNNVAITPASRNSAIGLQGGFGNIFMGMWTTPWSDLDSLWGVGTVGFWGPVTSIIGRRETSGTAPNPNCGNGHIAGACDAVESGGGVGHAFWRRFSNAIFYHSPVMAGVQAKIAYMTNEGKANSSPSFNADPSAWSASVQWAGMGGRARVGAALDRHKDFTSIGATDTGYRVTGGWNFGVLDVGLAYEQMKYKCQANTQNASSPYATTASGTVGACAEDGDIKSKGYGVALAVPVGPGSIRASYSVLKDLEGPITNAATPGATGTRVSQTGAKQYNIGYEHRFSKRTNVGVGYAKIDNEANAALSWTGIPPNAGGVVNNPVFGSDVSTFFVSMTHRF